MPQVSPHQLSYSAMSPLLLAALVASVTGAPSLCSPGQLDVGGVDVIAASRGRILLAIRTSLSCRECHKHLREYSLMAESITDLSIALIVPDSESRNVIRHSQQEFPRLQILQDIYGVTAEWQEGEQILFDRCGRVARIMPPRKGTAPYRDALDAVRAALSHAHCGWCQYDTRGARDLSRKQMNAYLKEDTGEARRQPNYGRQPNGQWQSNNNRLQQPVTTQRTGQAVQYQQQYGHQRTPQQQYGQNSYGQQQLQQQQQQQYGQQQQQQQQPQREYQGRQGDQMTHQNYGQQYYQESRSGTNGPQTNSYQQQHVYRQEQGYQPTSNHVRQQQNFQEQPNPSQQNRYYNGQNEVPTPAWSDKPKVTTTTSPGPKSLYAEDSDYGDYDIPSVTTTTSRPETQISRPISQNVPFWWPTAPMPTQDFRLLLNADVPCAAYTDDICFHQQEKLGKASMPKCCSKGIYLTDLCVPGKCSNSTAQLCCLQKFLQAKYSCCEDESQSNGTTATNEFSKCCYSKFVQRPSKMEKLVLEDECCPAETAANYWSSVNELCYPNTRVDLSTVKLEVRFAEGVRVVDLGENRIWDHECRYGGNRLQLAYNP